MARTAIRSVQEGNAAPQPALIYDGVIPTYGGDTMLRIPPQEGRDDGAILKEVAHKVAEIYMAADNLSGQERIDHIREELKKYEESWS